ncbi:hypothetical protein BDR07DRAFT_1494168 [Suillus spraguei]|nr:hypothetical protein BDR07DRAFT_1494168 [Suillus spraguei]
MEAEHIAYAAVQARFAISSLDKWKDQDAQFYYTDFYSRIVNLIRGRIDGEWVNSLLGHYNKKLFGNEDSARPSHSMNAECSEDDDMVAIEQQLAACAAQVSGSSNAPAEQSSALDQQQELHHIYPPPAPDSSPSLYSPVAQAPANPLPPSSLQELNDEGLAGKHKENVIPVLLQLYVPLIIFRLLYLVYYVM